MVFNERYRTPAHTRALASVGDARPQAYRRHSLAAPWWLLANDERAADGGFGAPVSGRINDIAGTLLWFGMARETPYATALPAEIT